MLFVSVLINRWRHPTAAISQISRPILLSAVLSVLLFVGPWTWWPKPFTLVVPLRTSRAVQLKLYYTNGSEFREDWTTVRYADSRGAFKIYKLPIGTSRLKRLRLHVAPAVVLDLGQITLGRLAGSEMTIAPSAIRVNPNACRIEQHGDFTRFSTAADSDGFDIELYDSQEPIIHAPYLEHFLAGLLCCSLLALLWSVVRVRRGVASNRRVTTRTGRISGKAGGAVVLGLSMLLLLGVLLNLNGSSSAMWRYYVDGRLPDRGLGFGTAKDVRSDEWMVQTPWMLSQASTDPPFQTSNPNVGDGATGLLVNLPIRHWTTLFRPQFWGFFLLDVERAFAWYWNLKWYVLILGSFLFFRIVTRGHALATVSGMALVFFAPYVQWWYSTGAAMPETIGMTFVGLWAFYSVLRAPSQAKLFISAVTLLFAIENFVYCCYPRFQIPLTYFAALVALWMYLSSGPRRQYRVVRWSCLAGVLAIVGLFGVFWYAEVGSTLRMTAQLEYPGKVFSVGGDFPWARFFVPFLQFGMTEFHFPVGLTNACDAAGFILLLPFIAILLAARRDKARDLLVLLMLCFIAAVGYFMLVGVPRPLAKYSGWSLVYATRGILPVGIASVTCFVRLLSWRPHWQIRRWLAPIAAVGLGLGWWICLSAVNHDYDAFVSIPFLAGTAAYLGVTAVLFASEMRFVAVALLLLPAVTANALVNPIGHGLPGLYQSDTFNWLRSSARKDHTGRWLVIGHDSRSNYLSYFIKAAGGDVLGGIRCNPDMRVFNVLDPERKYFEVWNRFAVVAFNRSRDDTIEIKLTSGVSYTVTIPFSIEQLDGLGVRYILDVDTPIEESSVPGYRILSEQNGLRLRIREER